MERLKRSSKQTQPSIGRRAGHRVGSQSADTGVRRRKTNRSASTRRFEAREHSVPPVMVRGGGTIGLPWPAARSKQKPRRRYYRTLNMPGAEISLPAFPQVSIGWRLLSGAIVLSLAFALNFLWTSPRFHIQAAEVIGLQRITSWDINAVLGLMGEPIFAIDSSQLVERLQQAFPEFSGISMQVELPDRVVVYVEERQPLLVWKQDGRSILVDPNGYAFPMRSPEDPVPALAVESFSSPPVLEQNVENLDLPPFMPVEMVSAILSMSAQAPVGSPLVYDAQRGLGWRDVEGWQVYFGDVRNMDMKLKVYRALAEKLQSDGTAPALISVEHVHTPYYRLER